MKIIAYKTRFILSAALVLLLTLSSCSSLANSNGAQPGKLKVIATTTIVADVVHNVGGDAIQLDTLLSIGSDPHSFDPTPQDVAKVANADVVFANGAGLEEFLKSLLENAGGKAKVVSVSDGIELLQAPDLHLEPSSTEGEPEHPGGDPHTWFDPQNVQVWVQNIERSLSDLDPANASLYAANAQKYQDQLKQLDAWIQDQVSQVPPADRQLVTDHDSFTYFANRYGFTLVGAVIPGYSTLAQPSAQELARLEDAIRRLGVKAVFVGSTVNSAVEQRVAQDTGVRLVPIYTASLTGPEGLAPTYLDFMRYDVSKIVEALK